MDTLVQNNTITNNAGDGVRTDRLPANNTIGTPDAGDTSHRKPTGERVFGRGYWPSTTRIRGDVINSNGGPAIDLGGDGRP